MNKLLIKDQPDKSQDIYHKILVNYYPLSCVFLIKTKRYNIFPI